MTFKAVYMLKTLVVFFFFCYKSNILNSVERQLQLFLHKNSNNIIADNSICAALRNLLDFTPPDITDFAPIKFLCCCCAIFRSLISAVKRKKNYRRYQVILLVLTLHFHSANIPVLLSVVITTSSKF